MRPAMIKFEDVDMAKGQQRSNKETKKPKAIKASATPSTSDLLTKGMLTPPKATKKK